MHACRVRERGGEEASSSAFTACGQGVKTLSYAPGPMETDMMSELLGSAGSEATLKDLRKMKEAVSRACICVYLFVFVC